MRPAAALRRQPDRRGQPYSTAAHSRGPKRSHNRAAPQTMGDAKVAPTKTQRSPGAAWRRAAFERLEAARPRRKTRAQATRLEVERASAYYALNEAAIPDGLVAARRKPTVSAPTPLLRRRERQKPKVPALAVTKAPSPPKPPPPIRSTTSSWSRCVSPNIAAHNTSPRPTQNPPLLPLQPRPERRHIPFPDDRCPEAGGELGRDV